MSDASSATRTAIITIVASSLSAIIVGGLTGWFALQSMDKQSEIARITACYTFNTERAKSALHRLDAIYELGAQMALFKYKPEDNQTLEETTELFVKLMRNLKTLSLYTSEIMALEVEVAVETLGKIIAALHAKDTETANILFKESKVTFANFDQTLKNEMLLLRDPLAQCK